MENTKLISALKKLSIYEVNEFSDLVESPFFNKNQYVSRLWQILIPKIKNKQPIPTREMLSAKLFKAAYDEIKFNNILSDLYQLLEQYLIQKQLRQKQDLKDLLLMKQFNNWQLQKHFNHVERRQQQYFDEMPLHPEHPYLQHHIFDALDEYFMLQSKKQKTDYLLMKMQQFDLYFIIGKLKIACEMQNRQRILNLQYEIDLIDEAKKIVNKKPFFRDHPLVKIYLQIYLTFQEPEQEEHFNNLIALLTKHSPEINKEIALELYSYAQNYCIRKINSGKSTFLTEIFNIYKSLLQENLLHLNDFFSEWDYKNIVTTGIRLKEFEWVNNFIKNYKSKLDPEVAENAYIYNLSTLYFAEKKYDNAIELLRDVEFTDVLYHLSAKTTLLKIYFEKQEVEAFYNLTATFSTYLHRNKLISNVQKQSYKVMLSFAKKIFKLKNEADYISTKAYQQKYKKTEQRLQQVKTIANINWIKEIMKEAEIALT